jgi:glycosyltransferase involved in cell wall biosynthesis
MTPLPPSVRILMTVDAVGGVWSYAMDLARALAPRGIFFTLACMGPRPTPEQCAEVSSIPGAALEVSEFSLEWMPEPWADVDAAGGWLLELERRHRPALVHLNGFSHAALPFRAPRLVVGHSCCLSWWRAVHGTEPPPAWREYRRRVEAGIRSADLFIAPTHAMLAEFRRVYTLLPLARVIRNGLEPGPEPSPARDNLVLAAGRLWDDAKNTAILAEVGPRLPWPVLIAGQRQGPGGARCSARGLVCLGRLTRERVREHMSRAAIFIHPARYEPFGLAPLEAAASGCALVLADIPTLRELWGGAAVFASPRDPRALTDAALRLVENPPALRVRAHACRARALQYSLHRFASGYAGAYHELIGAAGCPVAPLQGAVA